MDVNFDNLRGKRIFVTGDTGFKGSWLVAWLRRLNCTVKGYSLGLPYSPTHYNLLGYDYESIHADILNREQLQQELRSFKPEIVFHLAAQALVFDSIQDPVHSFEVNFNGTLNLLQAIRETPGVTTVINVTTDKVYLNPENGKAFTETDALGGSDPYSASKSASEIVTKSYYDTFLKQQGIGLATARSGNVIGGGDWSAKRLIPDIIRSWQTASPIELRNPQGVRPWQHVLETIYGYLLLANQLQAKPEKISGAWNFGPGKNQTNTVRALAEACTQELPIQIQLADQSKKFAESELLNLDNSKSDEQLKWKNQLDFETTVKMTLAWYKSFYIEQKLITEDQLTEYINLLNK